MEFSAHKFDFDSDENKRKLDSIVEYNSCKYIIKKVDYKLLSYFVSMSNEDYNNFDKLGYDEVLFENHPIRPFIIFVYYLNKINEELLNTQVEELLHKKVDGMSI